MCRLRRDRGERLFLVRHPFVMCCGGMEAAWDRYVYLGMGRREGPNGLLLGGRAWRVTHLDWARRIAHVEATDEVGHSRWRGTGPTLGFRLCQTMNSAGRRNRESKF